MSEIVTPPLAEVAPKTPISPKVIAAAVASFVAPAVLLGLNYLLTPEGQQYFAGLPVILVVVLGGLLSSAITFVSSYLKRDPIREAAADVLPRRALVEGDNGF